MLMRAGGTDAAAETLHNGWLKAFVRTAEDVSPEMLSADYWIGRTPGADRVIMTVEEIESFNARVMDSMIAAEGPMYDLDDLASRYAASRPGICVRRSSLRFLPSGEPVNGGEEDSENDAAQNSGLLMNEPMVLMETSADGQWHWGYTYFGHGWVPAEDVAVCGSLEEWRSARKMEDFLVVAADAFPLEEGQEDAAVSGLELYMGTKLALVKTEDYPIRTGGRVPWGNYAVKIPARDEQGMLSWRYGFIPISRDVTAGYLPYTTANVLKQAFKMLGGRYGWGGMYHSRDCSQYSMELYRCFGFMLPRDSGSQAAMDCSRIAWDENVADEEKLEALKNVPPGSILRFPGHIMLYLGQARGQAYCISAVSSFAAGEEEAVQNVKSVAVNSLSVRRRSGKTWLECLTDAVMLTAP